jgi:hypothetical protein
MDQVKNEWSISKVPCWQLIIMNRKDRVFLLFFELHQAMLQSTISDILLGAAILGTGAFPHLSCMPHAHNMHWYFHKLRLPTRKLNDQRVYMSIFDWPIPSISAYGLFLYALQYWVVWRHHLRKKIRRVVKNLTVKWDLKRKRMGQ